MSAMRSIALLMLALTIAACGGDGTDGNKQQNYLDDPPLWNDYVVGYGETVNLAESVGVEFLEVVEDTRCPTGAQCASAGNARIRVRTLTVRGNAIVELNTDPTLPTSALFDYYGVSLRKLEPYPVLDPQTGSSTIPLHDYEATLFVVKAATPP
jgi:hypothetical protein